eukprot:358915-Chlamydomonas_euryale.AAC.2
MACLPTVRWAVCRGTIATSGAAATASVGLCAEAQSLPVELPQERPLGCVQRHNRFQWSCRNSVHWAVHAQTQRVQHSFPEAASCPSWSAIHDSLAVAAVLDP